MFTIIEDFIKIEEKTSLFSPLSLYCIYLYLYLYKTHLTASYRDRLTIVYPFL